MVRRHQHNRMKENEAPPNDVPSGLIHDISASIRHLFLRALLWFVALCCLSIVFSACVSKFEAGKVLFSLGSQAQQFLSR